MMIAAIVLVALAPTAPQHRVFECSGESLFPDDPPSSELVMKLSFWVSGRTLSPVEVTNPPTSGAYSRELTHIDDEWSGRVTRRGFLLRSNHQRTRYVEPGRIELRQSEGSDEVYTMTWTSYISGGHMIFGDSGSGQCRRSRSNELIDNGNNPL